MEKITLTPYTYRGVQSNFELVTVYVDSKNPSPDPSKILMWGFIAGTGETLKGDFKRYFKRATYFGQRGAERNCPAMILEFEPEGRLLTYAQEKAQRAQFIRSQVGGLVLVTVEETIRIKD
jgi:hypothetical protein